MKRIVASITLTVILLGSYFLIAVSVRRYFLLGPGPFAIGMLARDYFVPMLGPCSQKEEPYDENKALIVLFSVSFVSMTIPFYLLLSILDLRSRSRLP